jgi:calcineurin-like phosphoesterase
METQSVIETFLSGLPTRFTTVERGPVVFNAVLVQVDPETGKAGSIQRIDCEVE